jgi:hypothetical protein
VFCPQATAEAQGYKELGLDVAADQHASVHRRRSGACAWAEGRFAGDSGRLMFRCRSS